MDPLLRIGVKETVGTVALAWKKLTVREFSVYFEGLDRSQYY